MNNPKYIIPVDDKYWRVKVRITKRSISKCFNYSKHGGKKKALNEAKIWRNHILEQYDLVDRLKYKKSPDYYSDKIAVPVIGVYITYNINCEEYLFSWTARYQNDGVLGKQSFSIKKYGDKLAFLKACEVRFIHSGKLKIVNKHLIPWKIPREYL